MNQLKIGDKVRLKHRSHWCIGHNLMYNKKKVGKVIKITEHGVLNHWIMYEVKFVGTKGFIIPQYFREELIKVRI